MKTIKRILLNLMVGIPFTISTILTMKDYLIWGLIFFIVSYILLDIHTYLSNKYNLNAFEND